MMPRTLSLSLLLLALAVAPARAVEVQRVVSPGGIEALLVEDHTNPIISLELAFRGGSALDPEGREGLASMVSGLIDEGAGELDSQTFRTRMEELSIELSFDAGVDSFRGSLQTLTENRDTALELLRLALGAPRFDTEAVERIRAQIMAQLRQRSQDPDAIAARTLRRLFFDGHGYGHDTEGTMDSVGAIEVADLRRFVEQRFGRDVLEVAVVGDVTAEEVAGLLDRTFGALPAKAAPFAVPEAVPAAVGEVVVIEKDVPQSVVTFGHGGIKRHDPDFYAAYVVNYVLGGGGFSSRLFDEVREKRGLAYSIYSYLSPFDHAALVVGGVATANARVAEALGLIRAEWRRMAEQGPSAQELADAKTYLTGSFPLRLSSSGAIAGMLLDIQLEELGIDYLDRRNGYIEAVTLEQAQQVARRLYDPAALSVIVVGRPVGVEATRPAPPGAS